MPDTHFRDWVNSPSCHSPSSNSVSNSSKAEVEHLDDVEQVPTHGTQLSIAAAALPKDHQIYLLERHGTLDLDPVPGFGNADPYNWPAWKKIINLVLVAFHAAMSTITAGCITPAYSDIAADFNVTIEEAAYMTSIQIAILGVAPFVWKPISNRYGRRPVFLASLICSMAGNIGCGYCPSYATMAICRAIVAFFISPAAAIGSVVVTESFFKRQRPKYLGIWTLMVTVGVPFGPFVFGFVVQYIGYRWIFFILAIINAVQFILYLFLGPETRYLRKTSHHESSDFKQEYLNLLTRIDPTPLSIFEFIQPLTLARHPFILLPTCAYAMNFLFGSIMITVEIPQLFQQKFDLDAQQLGLQFIAVILGSVIGEQLGAILSNIWMTRKQHKCEILSGDEKQQKDQHRQNRQRKPEHRLWLSYIGFTLTIVGLIVFLVQTQAAKVGHWNITPLIGVAIAACGNQIVSTILVTYTVDTLGGPESGSVGVFITFVRQIWGFIGPFWFPSMFDNVGVANSAGICVGLLVAVGIIPTLFLQWKGVRWRGKVSGREA